MSAPYTLKEHGQRCRDAAARGDVLARQPVQARRGQAVYCATVYGPWIAPGGQQCWVLDTVFPSVGRILVPSYQVRQCGGQGCTCPHEVMHEH